MIYAITSTGHEFINWHIIKQSIDSSSSYTDDIDRMIITNIKQVAEQMAWCRDCASTGRFYQRNTLHFIREWYFELEADALLFNLQWG